MPIGDPAASDTVDPPRASGKKNDGCPAGEVRRID